jgi:hypothetical protein
VRTHARTSNLGIYQGKYWKAILIHQKKFNSLQKKLPCQGVGQFFILDIAKKQTSSKREIMDFQTRQM